MADDEKGLIRPVDPVPRALNHLRKKPDENPKAPSAKPKSKNAKGASLHVDTFEKTEGEDPDKSDAQEAYETAGKSWRQRKLLDRINEDKANKPTR